MNKKIFVFAFLILFIMTACNQENESEEYLNNFMQSVKTLNLEESKKYVEIDIIENYNELIVGNDEVLDINKINIDKIKMFQDNFRKLSNELEYEIKSVKENANHAEMIIELTYADASQPLTKSFKNTLEQIARANLSDKKMAPHEFTEIRIDTYNENLNDYKIITAKTKGTVHLNERDGKWLIVEIDKNIINALTFGLIEGVENIDKLDI